MAKPILFSTPMVQAILAGKKTQTRRVVKGVKDSTGWLIPLQGESEFGLSYADGAPTTHKCPYGEVGDLLWVRETFAYGKFETIPYLRHSFKATPCEGVVDKWKPSIFMPRHFSRITLEITDIRVEKLCDISESDSKAEGCQDYKEKFNIEPSGSIMWYARTAYAQLWDSINGKESFRQNPWVWVIEFKVHNCNVDNFNKDTKHGN